MSSGNHIHHKKTDKKEDGRFGSKNIKHDPGAESARAVFGLKENDDKKPNA
jgi:hypothetical protein